MSDDGVPRREPDLFYAGGEALTRFGTLVRETSSAEDLAKETHTRNSSAEAIGRDGVIRTWGADTPRVEWLSEVDVEATRNAVESSANFSDASWTTSRATKVYPDPTDTSVVFIQEDTTPANNHEVRTNPPVVPDGSTDYVVSFRVRPTVKRTGFRLNIQDGGQGVRLEYDLATGQGGTSIIGGLDWSPTAFRITKDGAWYRVEVQVRPQATAGLQVTFGPAKDGSGVYDGDGESGIFIAGVQVETADPITFDAGDWPEGQVANEGQTNCVVTPQFDGFVTAIASTSDGSESRAGFDGVAIANPGNTFRFTFEAVSGFGPEWGFLHVSDTSTFRRLQYTLDLGNGKLGQVISNTWLPDEVAIRAVKAEPGELHPIFGQFTKYTFDVEVGQAGVTGDLRVAVGPATSLTDRLSDTGAEVYVQAFAAELYPLSGEPIGVWSGPNPTAFQATPRNGDRYIPSLLLEAGATNYNVRSEDFAAWNPVAGATVTQNVATAPDGATTADQVTDPDAGQTSGVNLLASTTEPANTVWCFSVYVQKQTTFTHRLCIRHAFFNGGSFNCDLLVNPVTGGVDAFSSGHVGFGAIDAGDYWRVWVAADAGPNTDNRVYIYPAWDAAPSGSVASDPTATGSAVLWGAQVEIGSAPSSYIPAPSVAVTREADTFKAPWAENIGPFTIYAKWINGTAPTGRGVNRWVWGIGENNSTDDAFLGFYWRSGDDGVSFAYDEGISFQSFSLIGSQYNAEVGDLVETIMHWEPGRQSGLLWINGEFLGETAPITKGAPIEGAWADGGRFGMGDGIVPGADGAISRILAAKMHRGRQSLEFMRELGTPLEDAWTPGSIAAPVASGPSYVSPEPPPANTTPPLYEPPDGLPPPPYVPPATIPTSYPIANGGVGLIGGSYVGAVHFEDDQGTPGNSWGLTTRGYNPTQTIDLVVLGSPLTGGLYDFTRALRLSQGTYAGGPFGYEVRSIDQGVGWNADELPGLFDNGGHILLLEWKIAGDFGRIGPAWKMDGDDALFEALTLQSIFDAGDINFDAAEYSGATQSLLGIQNNSPIVWDGTYVWKRMRWVADGPGTYTIHKASWEYSQSEPASAEFNNVSAATVAKLTGGIGFMADSLNDGVGNDQQLVYLAWSADGSGAIQPPAPSNVNGYV